ncbi:MAG TPA: hypothetical protein VGO47_10755 [Chlamydiales bacterium]|jgi:hypothetical protein|nr:hypothetical protein [Chlamydiales bacterium]
MNKEIEKDLLNQAKALATTEELKSLIANLEEFMSLNNDIEGKEPTQKWAEARERLWDAFEKVSAGYGVTPEMIRENLKNPGSFLRDHKETVQTLQELEGTPKKKLKMRA